MVYEMKLNPEPFEKIRDGRKNVELRLYDEKRRKLEIGDDIIFTKLPDEEEKIAVRVKALLRFESFEDLFEMIPPERCGNEVGTSASEAVLGMRKYYSKEQERSRGVLGIGIYVIDLGETLARLEERREAQYERFFPDGMK